MKPHPLISVIIPTYNRAYCLPETIESVLAQSFKDFEIIIIDDGSTDNTVEVLQPYREKIIYKYQKNAGITEARNAGLKLCSGEWVALLDSDDIWYKDKLERQVKDVTEHPEIDVHITNANIYREHIGNEVSLFEFTGVTKMFSRQLEVIKSPVELQLKYGIAWVQCSLVRRKVLLDEGLYDTKLTIYTDFDLFCRLATSYTWGICLKEYVKIKREVSKPNVSSQRKKNPVHTYGTMIYVLNKMINTGKLKAKELSVAKRLLISNNAALGMTYLSSGQRIDARRTFKEIKSLKNWIRFILTFMPDAIIECYFKK